jgi:hypothetical protein
MNKLKLIASAIAVSVLGIGFLPLTASAASPAFGLQPFEYVGTAAECGGTAGVDTVTSRWDNTTGNPSPSILLEKLGPQENCAAAGVDIITPLEGQSISNLNELNFDVSGYCGGGAPRFNVVVNGNTYFLGCNGGVQTPTSNPNWTHVEFGPVQFAAAGIPLTGTLDDVYIIFDESGTTHIDNISVNNQVVGSPTSPTNKDECKNGGWQNYNPTFKNQGDCVSFVATGGKNPPSHKH